MVDRVRVLGCIKGRKGHGISLKASILELLVYRAFLGFATRDGLLGFFCLGLQVGL